MRRHCRECWRRGRRRWHIVHKTVVQHWPLCFNPSGPTKLVDRGFVLLFSFYRPLNAFLRQQTMAEETIYLCNFRVSVDGDWLCLRELSDVQLEMETDPISIEDGESKHRITQSLPRLLLVHRLLCTSSSRHQLDFRIARRRLWMTTFVWCWRLDDRWSCVVWLQDNSNFLIVRLNLNRFVLHQTRLESLLNLVNSTVYSSFLQMISHRQNNGVHNNKLNNSAWCFHCALVYVSGHYL